MASGTQQMCVMACATTTCPRPTTPHEPEGLSGSHSPGMKLVLPRKSAEKFSQHPQGLL